jgi:colanic acid/amylovoran biosynthesis glycosyltransferase
MKLAYLATTFPFGITETFFRPEVKSLSTYADVTLFATRPTQATSQYDDLGVDAHPRAVFDRDVARLALGEFARNPLGVLGCLATLSFASYRLDAKIKNLVLFPKALAFAADIRRLEIDHIHVQWITTPSTLAYIAARLTGKPWSITAHQHDIFAGNLLEKKVRSAAFTRVISQRNCHHLQEQLTPVAAGRCTVVHLGIDLPEEPISPPERTQIKLLSAARLVHWKGHRYLIEAFALLRQRGVEFTCDFAGVGELHDTIVEQIARAGLGDRVRMLGNFPHATMMRALAAGDYDASILASTETPGEHEGIPVAMMEAMGAGLPVVATRTGSTDELIDATCGILVEQRNPTQLADAIERLAGDRPLRLQLGTVGRMRVQNDFSTAATTRLLASLIESATPEFSNRSRHSGQRSRVAGNTET